LDSNSNNSGISDTPPVDGATPQSPAVERFLSCRWRKAAEDGVPEHCTHRDVLPLSGITGFAADSWCPDCAYYKAKRTPRKRTEPTSSTPWTRW
jgi:hypothetical protein